MHGEGVRVLGWDGGLHNGMVERRRILPLWVSGKRADNLKYLSAVLLRTMHC